ncbi:MAG: hypothetical protein A2201_05340 [Alicyclobacillus sp. RIFOXYA1_FULL_53_8]|nr:MAG: hypothetical protein A2201_05340 [Alicyclobacillus sp. RIFOXYA1_FULL_53_8]
MPVLPWLKRLFTVDDNVLSDQFTLQPPEDSQNGGSSSGSSPVSDTGSTQPENSGEGTSGQDVDAASDAEAGQPEAPQSGEPDFYTSPDDSTGAPTGAPADPVLRAQSHSRKPIPMKELVLQAEQRREGNGDASAPESFAEHPGSHGGTNKEAIPKQIEHVKEKLQKTFHMPMNKDVVIREFTIGMPGQWKAIAVFVDGLCDKNVTNLHVLQPLMLLAHIGEDKEGVQNRFDTVHDTLLPGNQIDKKDKWSDMTSGILTGSTAVFIDGVNRGLIIDTKGWEHRTVGLAQTEPVVRGAHDSFTENLRANTGLVRSRLRSEHLVTEMIPLGKLGQTDIAVMHIEGLTNKSLVAEVKRRLTAIDVDFIPDSGLVEQFIEDSPTTWVPQLMSTERPDRVAHMLTEGHVAIFVGHNPFVLTVPVVFWSLMQTPEDAYIKFPFGTFLRLLRWLALVTAVLMPAFYIAVTNYHPEMIPTDLLLAIAGSREKVPFPAIVEILLMEFSIELIREAGIRIPSVIGPTIGLVGALIIGQAAVQAGVVSPLLVIVIAVTALASFTVPNYNLSFTVRVSRFLFLVVAVMFGFYGMALLLTVIGVKLSVHKSFGVPFLSPVVPSSDSSPDVFVRGPSYRMNQRPAYLLTQQSWRQQPVTRPWSKGTQQGMDAKKNKASKRGQK